LGTGDCASVCCCGLQYGDNRNSIFLDELNPTLPVEEFCELLNSELSEDGLGLLCIENDDGQFVIVRQGDDEPLSSRELRELGVE
jgi:hypothetical protein